MVFRCLSNLKAKKRDSLHFSFFSLAKAQVKSHFSGSVSDDLVECGSISLATPKVSDFIV